MQKKKFCFLKISVVVYVCVYRMHASFDTQSRSQWSKIDFEFDFWLDLKLYVVLDLSRSFLKRDREILKDLKFRNRHHPQKIFRPLCYNWYHIITETKSDFSLIFPFLSQSIPLFHTQTKGKGAFMCLSCFGNLILQQDKNVFKNVIIFSNHKRTNT